MRQGRDQQWLVYGRGNFNAHLKIIPFFVDTKFKILILNVVRQKLNEAKNDEKNVAKCFNAGRALKYIDELTKNKNWNLRSKHDIYLHHQMKLSLRNKHT